MDKKSDEDLNKRIDNELKKKELEQKYGAWFSGSSKLPPGVESEWLRSIEEFEEQYDEAKSTTLYDFIGKPPFKKLEELKPGQVPSELQRLYDVMGRNHIALDTLCEVSDQELYRFITEELFDHEMDDMRVPGMTTHFIYEEFHPNAEYDIKQACDYFFRMTMGKMANVGGEGYDMLYIDTAHYKDAGGRSMDKQIVVDSINNFLSSFDRFEIKTYHLKNIEIAEDQKNAVAHFFIHYQGLFEKSNEAIDFKGDGCFKLKPSKYEGWDVYHIDLPGLTIGGEG